MGRNITLNTSYLSECLKRILYSLRGNLSHYWPSQCREKLKINGAVWCGAGENKHEAVTLWHYVKCLQTHKATWLDDGWNSTEQNVSTLMPVSLDLKKNTGPGHFWQPTLGCDCILWHSLFESSKSLQILKLSFLNTSFVHCGDVLSSAA